VASIAVAAALPFPLSIPFGLLAAYLDSRYVLPGVFGEDDPRPETLLGAELTGASEGDPYSIPFGRDCRAGGVIVWASPKVVSPGSGGKGGPASNIGKMDNVTQSLSIKFAKATKIESLDRVWANHKMVFDADPTFELTDFRYSIDTITVSTGIGTDTWARLARMAPSLPSLHDNFPVGAQFTIEDAGSNTGSAWQQVLKQSKKERP